MKMKPIPTNTVVHTPTEAEAKELLAILHENGYQMNYDENLSPIPCHVLAYRYFKVDSNFKLVNYSTKRQLVNAKCHIISLSEFKERYCEDEKPKPKFKVGDNVKIVNDCGCHAYGLIGMVELVEPRQVVVACSRGRLYCVPEWLEPYTEPETKDETKEDTKDEAKELNLCELLKGHEGEKFYSPFYGAMELKSISDGLLCFQNSNIGIDLLTNGQSQYAVDGYCAIFPSKALYEQYPLDPYAAWMKWQEEQTQYKLHLMLDAKPECAFSSEADSYELAFRTTADRDECIEEIKAIIEKYSKK